MSDHCSWLLNNGCNGLVIWGTTGEANSFSLDEKKEALSFLVEKGMPKEQLLIGAGLCSFTDTVSLSKFALELGINNLLLLPPFFYKNISDDGLYNFFCRVIKELADTNCRIYLYHIPPVSQIGFSFSLLERLIKDFPETVVGIKDSSGDWGHMQQLIKKNPGFKVFAGTETYLLDILKMGGPGCISASVNITAQLAGEIYNNWKDEKISQKMNELIEIRKTIEAYPVIPALKSIMAKISGREEWKNVRPPLVSLDNKNTEKLLIELSKFRNFKI